MVSDEGSITASAKTEEKLHAQKIVTLSDHPKGQLPTGGRLSKADRVKGVTRSLVTDALATLNKMADDCHKSPEMLENYYQLHHCLDYLKRFCEGKT